MASREMLERMLRNAQAAGDEEAVAQISQMLGASAPPTAAIPAAPPKGVKDFNEKMNYARQLERATSEAMDIITAIPPGEDIPGAGLGPYLISRAGKIGAGLGTVAGGALGAATSGGLGTLVGAGGGAAAGAALGEVAGGLGQKLISDKGLALQRALTNISQALIYLRSGKTINEQEALRILKSEGIDFNDPNADALIRQGLPRFVAGMRDDLLALEASDPQSAAFLRNQGSATPTDLVSRLNELLDNYNASQTPSGASGGW